MVSNVLQDHMGVMNHPMRILNGLDGISLLLFIHGELLYLECLELIRCLKKKKDKRFLVVDLVIFPFRILLSLYVQKIDRTFILDLHYIIHFKYLITVQILFLIILL